VQPSADGSRPGYAKQKKAGVGYEKRMKVKNYLTNLPKNSNIAVVELANKLNVGRTLIDGILKEKEFKDKNFTLVRRTGSLTDEKFAEEYKKFQKSDFFKTGQDSEFANYLNNTDFKPSAGEGKFTSGNVRSRRNALNIKTASTKGPTLTDKEILKEAKRLNIKNIKNLTSSELRSKVLRARTYEATKKKLEEDPKFKQDFQTKARKIQKKFKKKRMSTVEGRAQLLKQRRKDKQLEYQRKGLDPLATNADEALWRDSVITANKNVDGKGRFSIESGYSKSMSAKDYYSNKIKIKDNQTGKIFNYNNFKNYVNKNAGSFGLKNYDEAVKSYRQKYFINDKPGLRTSINYALIPNYNEGMTTSAYTIQHDFGRQNNPLKTSLAFYNENRKEYTIRTDFEKAWAASKKSKTPLADRKKAFNVFKKDLANLNIQSVPSMVTRERFFGKGLDLTDILKTAKKEGATLPRGVLKEASEFDKQTLNSIVSNSKLKQCKIPAADGGRIGFALSDECIRDGLNETKKAAAAGDQKAARQLVETAEAASKGGRLLKNVLGPGAILGEALFEGAIIGNKVLGGKPLKQAWAESYLSYLDPRKYSGELDPTLLQREQMLKSTADKNILQSGFDAQDRISAFNEARRKEELAEIRQRPDQLMTEAEREKLRAYEKQSSPFIKDSQLQKDADIISSEAFKDASNIAQEYIQGQEGKQRFDLGILGTPRGELSEDRRMFEANKAMKNLYTQFSDTQLMDMLENSKSLKAAGITPEQYMLLLGAGTKRITPAVTRTLSGLDAVRTDIQEQEALNRIAEAGGVANLAKGGRAGFKVGSLRKGIQTLIDKSVKSTPKDTTPDLDALIKKTLDEDFFDKKDRIIDNINAKIARARAKGLDSKEIAEGQIDFYDAITKSNFKTKTGPFFDYQKRKNKAGGGLLKQAGDRSGAPPESGPNSQGLQGLLNRVKKI